MWKGRSKQEVLAEVARFVEVFFGLKVEAARCRVSRARPHIQVVCGKGTWRAQVLAGSGNLFSLAEGVRLCSNSLLLEPFRTIRRAVYDDTQGQIWLFEHEELVYRSVLPDDFEPSQSEELLNRCREIRWEARGDAVERAEDIERLVVDATNSLPILRKCHWRPPARTGSFWDLWHVLRWLGRRAGNRVRGGDN